MTIHNIIVHQLAYCDQNTALVATPAANSLTPTPALEAMVAELQQTYNKKQDKRYGLFNTEPTEDNSAHFPDRLADYLAGTLDFTRLSGYLLEQLKDQLNQAGALSGGYVLCTDYQQGMSRCLLLCLLSSHISVTVTQDLTITDCSYLDTSRMPLACRINMTDWQANPDGGRYLSFLRPRGGRRLTEAFQQAIGCSETSGSKEDADTLMGAVQDYCREAPAENRNEVKRQVYEYCQDRLDQGQAISLSELTGHLSTTGSDDFAHFVTAHDHDISQSITPQRRSLKQLIRYSGRSKGLNLSFDAALLGSQIHYDPENDQLVISAIPDSLKAQLKQS